MVLGRDKNASCCDERHNLVFRLSTEVSDTLKVLPDVRHLEVGIIS